MGMTSLLLALAGIITTIIHYARYGTQTISTDGLSINAITSSGTRQDATPHTLQSLNLRTIL